MTEHKETDSYFVRENSKMHIRLQSKVPTDLELEKQTPKAVPISEKPSASENSKKLSLRNKIMIAIMIAIIIAIILISIIVIVFFVVKKKKKDNDTELIIKEQLVANVIRKENEITRYIDIKTTKMKMEMGDNITQNETIITTDCLIDINSITNADNNKTLLYDAFFVIISIKRKDSDNEETLIGGIDIFQDDIEMEEDIEEIEGDEDLSDLTSEEIENFKQTITKNDVELPVIKFSFYENGTLNELYFPNNFDVFMESISKDIILKLIPQISESLYTKKENDTNRLLLSEENGKEYETINNSTILYDIESRGVSTGEIEMDKSHVVSNTQTTIEEGDVKNITSQGDVQFLSEDNVEYNSPNIDEDSAFTEEDTKDMKDSTLKNEFKSLSSSTSSVTNLINKTINETLTNRIKNISDTIEYRIYDDTVQNNQTLRLLRQLNLDESAVYTRNISSIPKFKSRKQIRNLGISSLTKPIEFTYPIFKINILGLKTSLNAVITVNTKSGVIHIDVVLIIGKIQLLFFEMEKETKLGTGLAKSIEGANHLIRLVNGLVSSIHSKTESWINTIANNINKVSAKLTNVYDISSTYNIPMRDLYDNIKDFSVEIFSEIKDVISKASKALISLLEKIKTSDISVIDDIIKEIASEYQIFVTTMKESIDVFHTNGLQYIENLEKSLTGLEDFSIDLMYDIKDQVEKVVDIYSNFVEDLFSSVASGIDSFEKSVRTTVTEIIGEVLNVIEFIASAFEENEIMRMIMSESERVETINLLREFRNKINSLIEFIMNKLNETYNSGTNGSLKSELTSKMNIKITEFVNKSKKMLEDVKGKIKSIKQFDMYIGNIDILEDIENRFTSVIKDKLDEYFISPFQEMKGYLEDNLIEKVKNELNDKANIIKRKCTNEANEIKNALKEIETELKQKYSKRLSKVSTLIIESFRDEKFTKIFIYFESVIKAQIENINQIIIDNFSLSFKYISDVVAKANEIRPHYYGVRGTQTYENNCQIYLNKYVQFSNFLTSNYTELLQSKFISIGTILKSFLEEKLAFSFLDELSKFGDFSYIQFYRDYILSMNNKIDSFFNEEIFQNKFTPIIEEQISNKIMTTYSQKMDEYITRKQSVQFEYRDCSGDISGLEKIKHDFHSPSYHCHPYWVSSNTLYNNIVTSFPDNYIVEEINEAVDSISKEIQPYFEEYNEIVNDIYNTMQNAIKSKLKNFDEIKSLLLEYENTTYEYVDDFLDEKIVSSLYEKYTSKLEEKIEIYYSNIYSSIEEYNITFYDKYFKLNITSYLEFPKEILYKLNQMLISKIDKGEEIITTIEELISSEIKNQINHAYYVFDDLIIDSVENIIQTFPKYPLSAFENERINFITEMKDNITSFYANKLSIIINEEYQSKLLEVPLDDFYNIKKEISSYKTMIMDTFEQFVDMIRKESDDYFLNKAEEVFNKYNFNIIKLREVVKYYKDIYAKISNIAKTDKFSYEELVNLISQSANIKVESFIGQVSAYLTEINDNTTKLLQPYIESIKDQVKSVLDMLVNRNVLESKINDYADSIFVLSNEIINQEETFIRKFNESLIYQFTNQSRYYEDLLSSDIKIVFDEKRLNDSFTSLVSKVNESFLIIEETINNMPLNEEIIDETTDKLLNLYEETVKKTKEAVKDFGEKYSKINLLNLTYSIVDIANTAFDEVYFDNLNGIIFNTSSILIEKYVVFRDNIKSRIIHSEEEILETLNKTYEQFLINFRKYAELIPEESNSTIEVQVIELNDFVIKEVILTRDVYKNQIDSLYSKENITELIKNNFKFSDYILEIQGDIKEIISNIKDSSECFINECKYRLETELMFFENKIVSIIKSTFDYSITTLLDKYGNLLISKVTRGLGKYGIIPTIKEINSKLHSENEYIDFLLESTTELAESTKLVFKSLYPKIITKIEEEIEKKITKAVNSFISKISNKLSDIIITKFTEIIRGSNTIKYKISTKVVNIINKYLNEKTTKILAESFSTIFDSKIRKEISLELDTEVSTYIKEVKDYLTSKKNEIVSLLLSKGTKLIDSVFDNVVSLQKSFQKIIEQQITDFVFVIGEKPIALFSSFLSDTVFPIVSEITSKYDILQAQLIEKISEKVDKFDNYFEKVVDKFPTELIANVTKDAITKVNTCLDKVETYIYDKIDLFEEMINSALNDLFGNRRLESISDKLGISEVKKVIEKFQDVVDTLKNTITSLKSATKLFNLFNYFKSTLKNGMSHIKDPVNNIVNKLKTFLTEGAIQQFRDKVEEEINQIIALVKNHYSEITELVEKLIYRVKQYPKTLSNNIKDKGKQLMFGILERIFDRILSGVPPVTLAEQGNEKSITVFNMIIPVFFIPFEFEVKFRYGYNYGARLGVEKLNIYLDLYGSAYAYIDCEATVSIKILKFGGGISGLLGKGTVGVRPQFSLMNFRVNVDAYFKLRAFGFEIYVTITYPSIKLKWIKIRIARFIKIRIPIIIIYMRTSKYGNIGYKGIGVEKHILKDY